MLFIYSLHAVITVVFKKLPIGNYLYTCDKK